MATAKRSTGTRSSGKKTSSVRSKRGATGTRPKEKAETRAPAGVASTSAPSLREARRLCTASELALVTRARGREPMTKALLGKAIERTRKLRNKFRDLAAEQRRSGRGKGRNAASSSATAEGNARTFMKAELFADTLAKFEAKLAKLGTVGAAKKAVRKTSRLKKAKTERSGKTPRASRQRMRRALSAEVEADGASATKSGRGVGGRRTNTATASSVGKSSARKKAAGKKKTSKSVAAASGEVGGRAGAKASAAAAKKVTRAPASKKRTSRRAAPSMTTAFKDGSKGMADVEFESTLAGVAGRQGKISRRGARVSAKFREANAPKIHGHVSARGRRNQAKRDSRG